MNENEFVIYLKKIDDRGLFTTVKVSGYGDMALEAIVFNEQLNKKGYSLTTYYGTRFTRCWGIYDKNGGRPQRVRDCVLYESQYFRPERRKTKNCGGYKSLLELETKFDNYLLNEKRS